MPLTPAEHLLVLAAFAVDEQDERRLSEFIAGATPSPATYALYETDARTGRATGAAVCAIVVDVDEDPVLAELFALRDELTEAEFLERWDVRAQWSALSEPGCAEALVRLELLVRAPRPSLHRFLLGARANVPALTLACQGRPTFLVPRDLVGCSGLHAVLLASLPVDQLKQSYDGALAIALADIGAPGVRPPSASAREASRRSAGR